MKYLVSIALLLALVGCKSKSAEPAAGNASKPDAPKAKVYHLEDVDKELADAGVTMDSAPDAADEFFKAHPVYHVCQKTDASVIAVVRNPKTNNPADADQFIVLAYRDGKLANREVGPAMFSVGNLESACR